MAAGGKKTGTTLIVVAILILLLLVGAYAVIKFVPLPFLSGLRGGGGDQAAATTPTPAPATVDVVVITQPISRGGVIGPDVVTLAPIPQTQFTEGLFFKDVAEVVNKRALFDLPAGMPVNASMLIDTQKSSMPAFDIPTGMVAITIPISRLTAVGFAPAAGDHVNLMVAMQLTDLDSSFQSRLPNVSGSIIAPGPQGENGGTTATVTITGPGPAIGRAELDPVLNQAIYLMASEPQRPRLVSATLVQDAVVLWVGDFANYGPVGQPAPTPTPSPNGEAQAAPVVVKPDIITLVVSPQDAVTINYLMLAGAKLNLALRGAGDTSRVQTEAVTLQFIMDQYRIPLPSKQPYGIEPRVDQLTYPKLTNDPQ